MSPGSNFNVSEVKRGDHSKPIRVLTINMYMRPPLVSDNPGGDYKNERLDAFFEHYLDNFDIICFQEVFTLGNTRKERLIRKAEDAGLLYHAVSDPPSFFQSNIIDGGLLTISRYPITDVDFWNYKYP